MEEKYLIFIFGTIVLVPLGIVVASQSLRALNLIFIALVLGTMQPSALFGLPASINFLSHEWYRGSTRGIEISYLDLLAIILIFSSKAWRKKERILSYTPPSYKLLKLYFAWACISVLVFSTPMIFGVFELTKILRGIIVFLAISAYVRSDEQVRIFVYAILAIAFVEPSVAIYHRYVLGIHRVYGTLSHANSLSMYCLQIFPITLSLWFAEDLSKRIRNLALITSALVAVTIILTISRTGFATLALLAFMTLALNIRTKLSARNVSILFLAMAIGAAMTYKAWDSLSSRFANTDLGNEYMSKEGDRGSYFRKGWPAFEDNPVTGIGLNNWSYWMSNKYSAKAGYQSDSYPNIDKAPLAINQEAPAHNLYLLTAVEMGTIGFFLLVAIFLRWLYMSTSELFKPKGDFTDQLRIGFALSLLAILMQSLTEWEFRQTPMFFLGHIIMSVSAYLYHIRKTT